MRLATFGVGMAMSAVLALSSLGTSFAGVGRPQTLVDINASAPLSLSGVDNPCTPGPDGIALSGKVHYMYTAVADAAGTTVSVRLRSNVHAQGADAAGRRYVLNAGDEVRYTIDRDSFDEAAPPDFNPRPAGTQSPSPYRLPLKDIYRWKVVGQGQAADFSILAHANVTANGFSFDRVEVACR